MSTRQPPGPATAVGGDGVTFARAGEAGPAPASRHLTPWRPVFFGAVVLAILAGTGWALLGSSLLVVRHVAVTGNRLVTAAQVRQEAGIKPGTPLATVNGGAVAARVERLAPVLSAAVSRSWPDGIVITAMVLRQLPAEVRTRLRWVSAASASAVTLHLAGRVTVLWGGLGRAAQKSAELTLLLRTHARYYDISDPGTAVTQG